MMSYAWYICWIIESFLGWFERLDFKWKHDVVAHLTGLSGVVKRPDFGGHVGLGNPVTPDSQRSCRISYYMVFHYLA